MKRFVLCLSFGAVCGLAAAQQSLPFVEHFSYSAGNIGTVSSGLWTAHSAANTSPSQVVTTPSDQGSSLNYPGLTGVAGNRLFTTHGSGSREDAGVDFTTVTVGTVYSSFLLKVHSVGATEDYSVMFASGGVSTDFRSRLYLKSATAGKYSLGLAYGSVGGTTATQYLASEYTLGTTYLVVLGYQINAGSLDDVAHIWVNPLLGQASAPSPNLSVAFNLSGSSTGAEITPGRLAIRQGNSGVATLDIDEIRIATTWAGVTPGTNPSSVTDWALFQ